jgi:hypothetical protein
MNVFIYTVVPKEVKGIFCPISVAVASSLLTENLFLPVLQFSLNGQWPGV